MTRDPDPVHTFAEARELALESGGTPPRQCESCGYERHSVSWYGVSAENEDLAPIRGKWSCEICYLRTLAVVTGKPWRVCERQRLTRKTKSPALRSCPPLRLPTDRGVGGAEPLPGHGQARGLIASRRIQIPG